MSLTLKIISPTNMPNGQLPEFTFDELGGSIGRKPSNDFVLIDPERFISSQHANIAFQNGNFSITDTSTNGVFINNAKRPIGTGNSQALSNGDKISIGEFQLETVLTDSLKKNASDPIIAAPIDLATPASGSLFDFNEPLIQDNMSNLDSVDPLALLGNINPASTANGSDFLTPQTSPQDSPFGITPDDAFLSSNPADVTNDDFFGDILNNPHENIPEPLPINEPFTPPSAIPDDWDIMADDLLAPSTTPANNAKQNISDDALFQTTATQTSNTENLFPDSDFPETQIENTTPLIPESESLFDDDDIFASLTSSAQPLSSGMQNIIEKGATEKNKARQDLVQQKVQQKAQQKAQQANAVAAPPTNPAAHFSTTAAQNRTANNNHELLNAFITGAGLIPSQVNTDNPIELLTKLGQLTRISTEGLMMALRARATIKSSFRVNKTIIAPVENNPLKFSVTSEDALKIIFAEEKAGYMPATEAFSEGFKDLQTHQMAMMAGMQAIIKEITTQFSPQTLERKFETQKTGNSFMPSNKKAKNWEMYEIFYKK